MPQQIDSRGKVLTIRPVAGKHAMDTFLKKKEFTEVVAVNRVYILLADGNYEAAFVLAQILYWQETCHDPNGWVYKKAQEWQDEWRLSLYKINRIVDLLAPYGLEYKVAAVNNVPMMHFHINVSLLQEHIMKKFQNAPAEQDLLDETMPVEHNEEISECPPEHSELPQEFQNAQLNSFSIVQTERSTTDYYDANASASAADADAVPAQKPTSKSKQPRASPTTPPGKTAEPPDLTALRAACFRLSKEVDDHPVAGQVAGIARTLFAQHFTPEEIEGCWHESLRDPAFNNATRVPGLKDLLPNRIRAYRKNAASYHTEIDRRVAARQQQAERERKQHHGHVPTTRRTDLVDQPGYFDQPNAPGAQPAGLAENDPW